MLKLNASTKFKKDYKLCKKRGYNLDLLQAIIDTLRIPEPLPDKNREHMLTGNYTGCRECHVLPDWLLIYRVDGEELYLVRTGSHSDLFGL
ncbi:MAG: type II toxin-antitoxin system YafQ family toxin [Lachnospiraceae bacterium]|nr:type II toxin-antitoxin system YafQ family toxin [Lachnospiraceae bacterium]